MNKSNFFKTFCKTACKSEPDRVIAAACSARAKRSTRVWFLRTGYSRLDPVGSTVRYEMMKLCIGSV